MWKYVGAWKEQGGVKYSIGEYLMKNSMLSKAADDFRVSFSLKQREARKRVVSGLEWGTVSRRGAIKRP